MSIEIRDSIYSDIASQFPDIYQENSDFLVKFIEAYYQHLDSKFDRDIPKLRDVDTTLTAFLVHYRNKYMADLPLAMKPPIDVRFILKHITNLYTRKGTKESLELLFKMFFDEDIEVIYPGASVLRASDSIWGGEAFLEMKTVYDVSDYPIKRGNTIIGDLSQSQAFVDGVVFVTFGGAKTPIIYLSQQQGEFSAEDSLEVRGADESGNDFTKNVGKLIAGSLSSLEISKTGRQPGQAMGDTVNFVSRKNGVGAKGVITKVSDESIGTIDYTVVDGGFGYIDPQSVKIGGIAYEIADEQKVRISNQVIVLEGLEERNIKKGDTITFPGSTVDYDGSEELDENGRIKPKYSITGAAVVTEYRHPLVFIRTEKSKDQLFDYLADSYEFQQGPNTIYRNSLYDAFYNAYQIAKSPPDTSVTFPVPNLDIMQVITDLYEDTSRGVVGSFTGKEKPTATVASYYGNLTRMVLTEGLASNNFTIGETIQHIDYPNTYGRAKITDIDEVNNRLIIEAFEVGETLTAQDGETLEVVSIDLTSGTSGFQITTTPNGANGFSLNDTVTGSVTGHSGIILAIDTSTNTVEILPFATNASIKGTVGRDHIGDLSLGSNVVRIDDLKTISTYIFGLNNGLNDGVGDNDDWLNPSAALEVSGAQGTNTLETDLVDRTPTISPVIPQTETTIFPTLSLSELKSGQVYTVVNPGTNLTANDWVVIGAKKGIMGEDFKYDTRFLNQLNTNVVDLSSGELVTSTLSRFDALFSPAKQCYAAMLNFLARSEVFPKLTVGTAFAYPISGDYSHYSNYHTSIQDLVPGRKYIVSDFGNSTYTDWANSGFTLNSINTYDLEVLANYSSILPGRTYIVKEIGTTNLATWNSLGWVGDEVPPIGTKITIPNPKPGIVSGSGKVIDIAAINATGVNNPTQFFTATAIPDNYTLSNTSGLCIDYDNVKGTILDPSDLTTPVNPQQYTSGGVFVQPELNGAVERRTIIDDINSSASFIGYVNGDFKNTVECVSLSEINESSSFELDSIVDTETITLTRDRIGDYYRELIDPSVPDLTDPYGDASYEMLGIGNEDINTQLGVAFGEITFTMGTLSTINENNPGINYQNDVGVQVVNKLIASLNKKDVILNFELGNFTLEKDEVVSQVITIPGEALDEVNNPSAEDISEFAITSTGAGATNSSTTFEYGDREYTAKAKFIKQEGKDYYFRPLSFYGFDSSIPLPIRSIPRNITKLAQDENSLPMGANAVIDGSASYSSGQIEDVNITHTGYKYLTGDIVDIVNTNPESDQFERTVASAVVGSFSQGNTKGRWKSKNSFLNESGVKIHDNDYYQEYSYDIKSMIDRDIYKPLVDDVVGVAGTKMFNTPLINSNNSIDTNLTVEVVFFDVDSEELHAQGYSYSYSTMPGTVVSVNDAGVLTGTSFNVSVNDLIRVSGSNTGVGSIPLFEFDLNADAPIIYKVSAASSTNITLVTEDDQPITTVSGALGGLQFDVATRVDMPSAGEVLVTENDAVSEEDGIPYHVTVVSQEGSIIED